MPAGYTIITFYIIYFLKRCESIIYSTNPQIKYSEVWIMMETMVFMFRIFGGIIFLLISYITKIQPFVRHSFLLEFDDNPWNNRDTEDFLRHFKVEYYLVTQ